MRLVRFIIKRLVTWYYKRTHFLSFSWSLDENEEIYISSAEYSDTGYRVGTREVIYETDAAEPVMCGHWIDYEYSHESQCSICGHIWNWINNDMETFNYCPNCGARMHKQVTGKLPASEEEE